MSDDRLRAPWAAPLEEKFVPKSLLDRSESPDIPSEASESLRARMRLPGGARALIKANFALLVIVVLVAASFLFAVSSLPAKMETYTVRGPIVIASDSDWTPANGVVSGSGAPADPWVISGWHIMLSGGVAISVSDTTAYFVIADVRINGTLDRTDAITGVSFVSVYYGQVKDCLMEDIDSGVSVRFSYDCSVHGNDLLGVAGWGVTIENSNRIHVVDNHFESANGIQGTTWEQSYVMLNEFQSLEKCVSAIDVNTLTIQENLAFGCSYGVEMSWSTNVQVTHNQFFDCMYGIDFNRVTYSDIRGNLIERSEIGINIWSSSRILTITDNVVNGTHTEGGMYIRDSWDMVITRNTISNNSMVVGFFQGGGICVASGCSNTVIYNNSFIDNLPQQAHDSSAINWNEVYPVGGNYWSDYSGSDENSGIDQDIPGPDGFGDTPYTFTGGQDDYPLMTRVPDPVAPVAVFVADPVLGDVTMTISFNASSSYHPTPSKNITGYRWDFDCDGKFDTSWSSDPAMTHLFPVPGNYTVVLEVEDIDGMTDMMTLVVVILEEGIIPEFGSVALVAVIVATMVLAVVGRRKPQT